MLKLFKRKEFLVIFIIQVTEVLGFSLILPFLPFLAQDLGASPLMVGLILTSFSLFQFFSAPILGRLSDIYGRKPLLMISQFSTFLGFLVLGFAHTLPMIFLSRAIDGIFGSNFTIAQAYLADISSKEERSIVFGISGMAFGVGFLIGPAFGGFLATFNYALPSFVAAIFAFSTIFITNKYLKETVIRNNDKAFDIKDVKIFSLESFKKYAYGKGVSAKVWTYFFYLLAHMIYVSNFALFGERQIGVTAATIGYLLAYVGLTSIILRGFLLEKLIVLFTEQRLTYLSFISICIGMITAAYIHTPILYLISITFFSFGTGILRPVLMGEISRSVSKKKQGELFGVTDALGSVTQITAPLISGFLLTYLFPGSVPILTFIVAMVGFLFVVLDDPMFQVMYKSAKKTL